MKQIYAGRLANNYEYSAKLSIALEYYLNKSLGMKQ